MNIRIIPYIQEYVNSLPVGAKFTTSDVYSHLKNDVRARYWLGSKRMVTGQIYAVPNVEVSHRDTDHTIIWERVA